MSTNTSHSQKPAGAQISDTTAFDLLSNARRRSLIEWLVQIGETRISDLAVHVADELNHPTENVHVSLHHIHHPKHEEYGVIERDGETVRLGENAPAIRRYNVTNRV